MDTDAVQRSISMSDKSLLIDNEAGHTKASSTEILPIEVQQSSLIKPDCISDEKQNSCHNEGLRSHVTSYRNVSIINVNKKQLSGGHNDLKNMNILPCTSGDFHGLQTKEKSAAISTKHSDASSELIRTGEAHECNTFSCCNTVATHDSVIPSHDGGKSSHDGGKSLHDSVIPSHDGGKSLHDSVISSHDGGKSSHDGGKSSHDSKISSCNQVVPFPLSDEGRDRKVYDNVAESSGEDQKLLHSVNQHCSCTESVMLRGSINCGKRELPSWGINTVDKHKKTQSLNDVEVANTSYNTNHDGSEKLANNLSNGLDINSQDSESNDMKDNFISPIAGESKEMKGNFISPVAGESNGISHLAVGNNDRLCHAKECLSEDADEHSKSQAERQAGEANFVTAVRRHKLERNQSTEVVSDDSSDEDVGIYAESFRHSNWICADQDGKLGLKILSLSSLRPARSSTSVPVRSASSNMRSSSTDTTDGEFPTRDEVFSDPHSLASSNATGMHKRSNSITSTASEAEFKHQYVSRRKCLIQRANSQQEYHRLSSRMYDQDRQVTVERISDSEDLGLHLLDSYPAFITSVDSGSAADRAGLTDGQILVSVNGENVLTTGHADIVKLIQGLKGSVRLGVANSDFQPVRDLQASAMSGYMYKLGNSAFKIWKRRHFILRQDNCLYYYKSHQETDPLGAFPLGGYTIARHTETNKEFCFKAEKYGGRTYYFSTDSRDQMTEWVGALTEASARSKKRKESFLSVSSHNVGLPALHIPKPECAGFLGKLSPSRRSWKRRYCVLKDACVYYYKDRGASSALGVIHLHGYSVDVENYQRRKFSLMLQPPETKMKTFAFSADNATDKNRWVDSLTYSIQRWVQADKDIDPA